MIISHRHKFIFFAVPKTGTHAVRFALRPHLGKDDEEQVGLYVKRRMPQAELAKLRHGHITCQQAKSVLGDEVWDNYFKFAFVRNPFDRFVSYCAFLKRQNRAFQKDPLPRMKETLQSPQAHGHILFRPQSELLCDGQGNVMVDFVGRYEDFQNYFDEACFRIGIPTQPLEHVNASRHRNFWEYYDEELKEAVAEFYRKDLEIFGYSFELVKEEHLISIIKMKR